MDDWEKRRAVQQAVRAVNIIINREGLDDELGSCIVEEMLHLGWTPPE